MKIKALKRRVGIFTFFSLRTKGMVMIIRLLKEHRMGPLYKASSMS